MAELSVPIRITFGRGTSDEYSTALDRPLHPPAPPHSRTTTLSFTLKHSKTTDPSMNDEPVWPEEDTRLLAELSSHLAGQVAHRYTMLQEEARSATPTERLISAFSLVIAAELIRARCPGCIDAHGFCSKHGHTVPQIGAAMGERLMAWAVNRDGVASARLRTSRRFHVMDVVFSDGRNLSEHEFPGADAWEVMSAECSRGDEWRLELTAWMGPDETFTLTDAPTQAVEDDSIRATFIAPRRDPFGEGSLFFLTDGTISPRPVSGDSRRYVCRSTSSRRLDHRPRFLVTIEGVP